MSKRDRFTLPLPPGFRHSDFEWTLAPKQKTVSKKQRHLQKMNEQAKAKLEKIDREFEANCIKYLRRKLAAYEAIIKRDAERYK